MEPQPSQADTLTLRLTAKIFGNAKNNLLDKLVSVTDENVALKCEKLSQSLYHLEPAS